ncbi:MAG: hypothetical protein QNJ64_03210 [Crocosphaera sp.]|nr:hypothetical protein [Crocosphaera sp.]
MQNINNQPPLTKREEFRHPLTGFVFALIETWQENELNSIISTGINQNNEA